MVIPPQKRSFKNIFRPTRGRIYKPKPKQNPAPNHNPVGQGPRARRPQPPSHRLHSDSTYLSMIWLMVGRALHQIRFYQSNAAAESFMIPQKSFERLVRQVCEEVRLECRIYDYGVRWERDALIALQTMSEHVLTMSFELLYFVF